MSVVMLVGRLLSGDDSAAVVSDVPPCTTRTALAFGPPAEIKANVAAPPTRQTAVTTAANNLGRCQNLRP